ncbi:MAG TPA: NfeD family protein [Chitinophagales bacterium]|nr:NfeD family protein [Chitinophagales bacterium]
MKRTHHILTSFMLVLCIIVNTQAQNKTVYKFEIHEEIGPGMSRLTQSAIAAAEKQKADYILIDMDTYGGLVLDGDNIRTALLKTKIPTIVFVRNNAASAGALIAIACDSIYMTPGSTIGAASVVNQEGELMPEKYQSYMRKKMRATAEETGRNPLIAEGMTDENLVIDSIKEKGKIVTFSTREAIKYGYCNGEVEKPEDVLAKLKGGPYVMATHESSWIESFILWLVNPAISGVLLLVIFGGIYFEFKAPGTMLPILVSAIAAMFYFAPLYLEGLAANWEILIFGVGLILILLEIFVIPGFGIAGISGIVLTIAGLTLSLVRNIDFDFTFVPKGDLSLSLLMVSVAMALPLIMLIAFGQKIFDSRLFKKMGVHTEMKTSDGYSVRSTTLQNLIGSTGMAITNLRPSGKVEINGEQYDSIADGSFILRDAPVKVIRVQATYLIVQAV